MTPAPTLRSRASAGFARYGAMLILSASVLAMGGWLWFYGPVSAESLGAAPREESVATPR